MPNYYENINHALPELAELVLLGEEITSRAGVVKEVVHPEVIRLAKPQQRYITSPFRKANLAAQIAETMWVLAGHNDVQWLERYLPRAGDFSDDGLTWRGGYGPRLRSYGQQKLDQVEYVIDLLRADPATRRAVISIYDPSLDSQPGKDVPCNCFLQFTSRFGVLDLHVYARSNDLVWGWSGINAFEWSTLLEIVAAHTGQAVGALHFSIGSLHAYGRHWKKLDVLAREIPDYPGPAPAPSYAPSEASWSGLIDVWMEIEQDIRERAPLGADLTPILDQMTEPMFRSWLGVIAAYWTGDEKYLAPYSGTDLARAYAVSMKPEREPETEKFEGGRSFVEWANKLHTEKDAVYGDSWCRRGDYGILANIARKVDRLGSAGAGDTELDTVTDLLIYVLKYRAKLLGVHDEWSVSAVYNRLLHLNKSVKSESRSDDQLNEVLRDQFEDLEWKYLHDGGLGEGSVLNLDQMAGDAFALAARLYWKRGNAARRWEPTDA